MRKKGSSSSAPAPTFWAPKFLIAFPREKIAALKEAQKSDNIEDIKAKTKDLSEHMQKIGAELYETQSPNASKDTEAPKDKEEPKAEEGEFKEKK